MEDENPVVEGVLLLPPVGKVLKKSWQKKYCALFDRSSTGVARIEIYDNNTKPGNVKIHPLEDVIKLSRKSVNVINIIAKNSLFEFATVSEDESNLWFDVLKRVSFGTNVQENSLEQENDLYCSSDEGVFCVKLHPSEASQRCNLSSQYYILVVTSSALQLLDQTDNKLLFTWPFNYIRKYGYKEGNFTFEAGRKCTTGEGVFFLEHPSHNEIYRCLSARMKTMKKMLSGESVSSLIGCRDLQFALSMEPGSRCPLPPSLQDISNKSPLESHLSSVKSSVSSINLKKRIPEKPPRKYLPPKQEIHSRASRIVNNPGHEYADINIEESNPIKYDRVESRTDAWKTLGIQDPTHSEMVTKNSVDSYASWGTLIKPKSTGDVAKNEKGAPTIITEQTSSSISQNYDCLQHFGSSNALNDNPGYKTVPNNISIENLQQSDQTYYSWCTLPGVKPGRGKPEEIPAPAIMSETPADDQSYDRLNCLGKPVNQNVNANYKEISSPMPAIKLIPFSNLYEEVNVTSERLADDSHLGYAKIKKQPSIDKLKGFENHSNPASVGGTKDDQQTVAHQFQNHQPYAVISKPKRV
ncbi:docking protein 3 isoform X1 [Euwallacea similis]|uniref:docking protein 3 isoform X1 n=1 Tax=Euwallacea similis TaxID=1736056 RepID=UPI00344B6421